MPGVADVAQASCSFSTQPFLYLVTHRGQLLESSNGKSKPGEPSCSSGGLAELSAAKEPAGAGNFIAFGEARGGKATQN